LPIRSRPQSCTDPASWCRSPGQAAFLIGVLAEDRPEDLAEADEAAIGDGVKWRDRIAARLKRMPQSFAILEAL